MRKTVYDFTPPEIIGAIGDGTMPPDFASTIDLRLKSAGANYACLSLSIEPEHLKNVISCMKLMDIRGLAVHSSFEREIIKWVGKFDQNAEKCGFIDCIVRRKNLFAGKNIWAKAMLSIVREQNPKKLLIAGTGYHSKAAVSLLSEFEPEAVSKISDKQLKDLHPQGVIFDFTKGSVARRSKKIYTLEKVYDLRNSMLVDEIIGDDGQ